jgi:hypothetical protein
MRNKWVAIRIEYLHRIDGLSQVNSLRFQLADLLEEEEEWSEAARALMCISLDSGQR